MAQPTTARGTKLNILQGVTTGENTVYTAYCGLNARTFSFKTQTNDVYVPDCANPDDPAWRAVIKSGRSLSVSGSGLLDTEGSLPNYMTAYNSDVSLPYELSLAVPLAAGGGQWTCNMHLTQFDITGNDNDLTTVSISLESDGPVTFVPATA